MSKIKWTPPAFIRSNTVVNNLLIIRSEYGCFVIISQGPYRIFEKKFPEFSLRVQPNFPEFWTLIFLFFSKFNNILAQVKCMLHVATRTILAAYKIPWVFPELRQKVSKFPEFSRFSLSLPNLTNFSRFSRFSLSRRDPVSNEVFSTKIK